MQRYFLIDDEPPWRLAQPLIVPERHPTQPFAAAEAFLETYRPECAGCVLYDLQCPDERTRPRRRCTTGEFYLPVVVLTAHGRSARPVLP